MQTNKIDVAVYPNDGGDPLTFKDVNYVSLVAFDTWGIPAVISEAKYKAEGLPLTVLYINPGNVSAVHATRTA